MGFPVLCCTWVLLATTAPIAGTANGRSVDATPRLRAGDEFRLEMVHVRERSVEAQQSHTITTPVVVRVIAATPDGATIDWTPGVTTLSSREDGQDQLLRAASGITRDVRLRLVLTAEGKVAEVVNRDEVATRLRDGADTVVRELLGQLSADARPEFEGLASQALSPATLLAAATRQVEMYFGMSGTALKVGEPVEVEFERPNPFGGDPLPATFRVQAESATGTSAVITTETTYDAEALLQMMRHRIEQQTGRPVTPEEGAIVARVEIADDGRYLLDRDTGLMREVVLNRRVKAGDTRLDRWTFRLLAAPKR